MKYSFHPEALEEYLDAVAYYADIRSQLAESFIKAVETGVENILASPESWQVVGEDVRRHIIRRFPYGIYYSIEDDRIFIYAVMHLSRHPDYWKNRICPL
jgi:plasmid stabilization system protein ParE